LQRHHDEAAADAEQPAGEAADGADRGVDPPIV
jgi:hypothetical protein